MSAAVLLLLLLLLVGSGGAASNDDNVLHIGGIFPIAGEGGWQGGQVRVGPQGSGGFFLRAVYVYALFR